MYKILILITCTLFFACQSSENKETKTEKKISKKEKKAKNLVKSEHLNYDFEKANVPMQDFTFMPGKDTSLSYSSGTELKIEANSFLDANGNPIKTPVQIQYREFHNPLDFLVSGIPMSLDSGSIENTFMSAGMCEFRAYSNDEPVQINPDAPVVNEMSSQRTGTDYNLYFFNENSGQWEKKGKDETTDKVEAFGGPVRPVEKNPRKPILKVDHEYKPELNKYKDWVFQPVGNENTDNMSNYLKDMSVKQIGNKYQITFVQHDNSKNVVLCNRVYSPGQGYNEALLKYDKELRNFLEGKTDEKSITRKFEMPKPGIYNCDSPILRSEGFKKFTLNLSHKNEVHMIHLFDHSLNSKFKFVPFDKIIKMDPTHENTLLFLFLNGEVCEINNDQIKNWKPGSTIDINLSPKSFSTYDDLKAIVSKK